MLTRPATPHDLPHLHALLTRLGLPTAGLEQHLPHTLVTERPGHTLALASLEVHGTIGLLRSVAVHPDAQGTGLARQLVQQLIGMARTQHLTDLYLLTTTAEAYFPRFGFQTRPRAEAPAALHASREFQDACPATATLMYRHLQEES